MSVYWWLLMALLAVNLAVLPYFLFLLLTSLAAIFRTREHSGNADASTKFLIVIPAHNEEEGVATTVKSCRGANYPSLFFGVHVIADNCTDKTAALASEAGARVTERFDDVKKSKGYAIEYLLELLRRSAELDMLDAVVIIDADTTIDPNLLRAFDRALRRGHDWLQAYYTVANPDQSWRTRLMTYAFSMFNGVMQLGQNALGSSAGFKGNGMCFSTRGLRRRPWQSYGLVEDMEYSWTIRVAGEKILFLPEVSVYGAMLGSGGKAAANQRRRWEFGRSEIRKKYLGPVLRSPNLSWPDKVLSTCELMIPSMAGLAAIYLVVAGLDAVVWWLTAGSPHSVLRACLGAIAVVMTVGLSAYAISPFLAMRLPLRYISTIFLFPFYAGWKLMISLAGRPREWIRTAREPGH
jgi:cellulose synthase/poly-beta-1,6-N-acetylglucosamine synthase-like glycosyltransferase